MFFLIAAEQSCEAPGDGREGNVWREDLQGKPHAMHTLFVRQMHLNQSKLPLTKENPCQLRNKAPC